MKMHLLLSLMFVMILCGCEGEAPSNPVAQTTDLTHSGNITVDDVWTAEARHIIESELYIQRAVIVIEPGAEIQFREGAGISVMESGGLIADGSDEAITFGLADEGQGNWKNIYFGPNVNSDSCKLINCNFTNGGADENWAAVVYCRQTGITIRNCEISQSASNGVYLAGDCAHLDFEDNTITANDGAPILTAACNIPLIGDGNYTGNGSDVIEIVEGTIHSDATWQHFEIPFFVNTHLNVRNSAFDLSAGTTLIFANRRALRIGENSRFTANGEDGQIVFKGAEDQNGYWDGIHIRGQSSGLLNNCLIRYGGGNPQVPANIYIDDSHPVVTGCIIRNSGDYGMYVNGAPEVFTLSDNVISQNSGAPISIAAANLNLLDGNEFAGNARDVIEIRGGETEGVIRKPTTLSDFSVPYLIKNKVTIRSATLRIEENVRLKMDAGSQIDVMEGGGLIADGGSRMIEISGLDEFPGAWNCIHFSQFSNDNNCFLNFCNIKSGGGDSQRPANIYLNDSNATIKNCTISGSLHYGIYLAGSSNPVLENNHFIDNLN
ncbi:hypothetical protein GF337_09355, partial [candidate division KSB1 bacterium]|nr:hypothetical protein [candidate division KSB1 bacterium]